MGTVIHVSVPRCRAGFLSGILFLLLEGPPSTFGGRCSLVTVSFSVRVLWPRIVRF